MSVIVVHWGAYGEAPENTRAVFHRALEIEVDSLNWTSGPGLHDASRVSKSPP